MFQEFPSGNTCCAEQMAMDIPHAVGKREIWDVVLLWDYTPAGFKAHGPVHTTMRLRAGYA